jgi:cephalosporin-C deacetylase
MPFFDLPLSELQTYRPQRSEPNDYESFWAQTLAETRQHDLNAVFEPYDAALSLVDVYDVTFSGYGGQRVKGWYIRPAGLKRPLPCVVEYIGYGGGRALPHDRLVWANAGFAHLVMDTRGQGSANLPGDTPDLPDGANPFYPGFMTQGVLDPQTYYYRRVFTDAVRAIEAARSRGDVDGSRIAVTGGSQGGGISIAAAALVPDVEMCIPDVPFLCDFRRAVGRTDKHPYQEISHYLSIHRDHVERVFNTLDYFDGLNFAPRIHAKTFFSVALMDEICPPSTIYGTYNYIDAEKDIRVYGYNNHEGGGTFHNGEKLRFVRREWA